MIHKEALQNQRVAEALILHQDFTNRSNTLQCLGFLFQIVPFLLKLKAHSFHSLAKQSRHTSWEWIPFYQFKQFEYLERKETSSFLDLLVKTTSIELWALLVDSASFLWACFATCVNLQGALLHTPVRGSLWQTCCYSWQCEVESVISYPHDSR